MIVRVLHAPVMRDSCLPASKPNYRWVLSRGHERAHKGGCKLNDLGTESRSRSRQFYALACGYNLIAGRQTKTLWYRTN